MGCGHHACPVPSPRTETRVLPRTDPRGNDCLRTAKCEGAGSSHGQTRHFFRATSVYPLLAVPTTLYPPPCSPALGLSASVMSDILRRVKWEPASVFTSLVAGDLGQPCRDLGMFAFALGVLLILSPCPFSFLSCFAPRCIWTDAF